MRSLFSLLREEVQILHTGRVAVPPGDVPVYQELFRRLIESVPLAVLGNLALVGLMLVINAFSGHANAALISWVAGLSFLSAVRLGLSRRLPPAEGDPSDGFEILLALARKAVLFSSLTGLMWGVLPLVVMWQPGAVDQLYLSFLLAGIPAGALGSSSYLLISFVLLAAPILLLIAAILIIAQPLGWVGTTVICLVYLVFLSAAAFRIHNLFRESIAYRLSREELTARLSVQQEELRQKNQALDVALGDAQRATVAKSEFLAKMSHEIRTPVNGILGMTSIALDHEMPPEQRETLATVKESAEHLLSLINELLDHSKIEAGKLTLEKSPFDLKGMLDRTARLFSATASQRGVHLRFSRASAVPHYVLGDELRLGQIINNLISNAIKFTPLGGSITVQVEGEREEHGIVACLFKVTDTGIGIPAAQQLKIFDAFVQADSSVSRKHGGTGLGLTISANLAALMGGAITLESKEGHGSSFTLRVPLIVASEAEVVRAALSDTDSVLSTPHSSGAYVRERRALPTACTVLVAEDNRINQRLAQRVLEAEGFSVVLAGDGVQALQVLDRQSIDIVLMDCQMPGMDGYEATRRIRAHPLTAVASVPIVALTAHAMDEDREKCLAAGMNEYISKPFQRGHLIRTIRRLVSARRT